MKSVYNFRQFQAALKQVAPGLSDDDTRPVLQCVHIFGTESSHRIETADGFKAAWVTIAPLAGCALDVQLTPEAIKTLLKEKIARKDDPEITLDPTANKITVNGRTIADPFALDGQYPDIKYLLPRTFAGYYEVDPAELLQALKTARVFAREGSNVAQLHFQNSLIVYARSEETGESYNVVKFTAAHCPALRIGFNTSFLIDILKVCDPRPVRISLNKANTPAVLTDAAGLNWIVMPMHLDSGAILTESDIPGAEKYNSAGAYVYADEYTRRHPGLPHIAPHEIPVTPRELGPYDHPLTITDDPFPVEIFTPHAEPGAVVRDITTIWSYIEEDERKKSRDIKVIVLDLTNARPDPNAPIPAASVPLFANAKVSFAKCERCSDGPHLLRGGLCLACRETDQELARTHPENCN
jgi:hypothetical protein